MGYGLEGAITDGYSGAVLDKMKPYFREEKYSEGIVVAYRQLSEKIDAEYGAAPPDGLMAKEPKSDITAMPTEDEDYTLEDYFYLVCGLLLFLVIMYFFVVSI